MFVYVFIFVPLSKFRTDDWMLVKGGINIVFLDDSPFLTSYYILSAILLL